MKIRFVWPAVLLLAMALSGCGSTPAGEVQSADGGAVDPSALKQGDQVSVVGQCASTGIAEDGTLWVQTTDGPDGRTVVYRCEMLESFEAEAAECSLLEVVEVHGQFLSYFDLAESGADPETTAITVTLCDCEIVG